MLNPRQPWISLQIREHKAVLLDKLPSLERGWNASAQEISPNLQVLLHECTASIQKVQK